MIVEALHAVNGLLLVIQDRLSPKPCKRTELRQDRLKRSVEAYRKDLDIYMDAVKDIERQ